jgi:cell division protein FtsN
MNTTKLTPVYQALCVTALTSILMACQSAPQSKAGVDVIDGQHIEQVAADLKILMDKQQQHDQLLKEWQQLKPALSRLVVIEEELNLMISQLDQFATSSATAHTGPAVSEPTPSSNATVPASDQLAAPVKVEPSAANDTQHTEKRFALQITSLAEPLRLPVVWEQMKKKHPAELAGLEPNYEKISVSNTDYYRLKIGAYDTKQQAVQGCNKLKALGINCLVTRYVASDFSELPRL